jgi:hypothetical protein
VPYCMHLEIKSTTFSKPIKATGRTSGCLAMSPGVCFEDNACKCFENSESAPRAGCTDSTTSLDVYATLATIAQWICQTL